MTAASDVWSFGVLIHLLATGRLPFKTKEAMVRQELQWNQIEQSGVRLSQPLKAMLGQMLSKQPEQRPSLNHLLESPWFSTL